MPDASSIAAPAPHLASDAVLDLLTRWLALGGMQQVSGVVPDMTAFGKVIGGGMPVGAIGGPAEVMDKVNKGEFVDPALYYFRTAILFETASEKYSWLNGIIAIGTGSRPPEGPVYDVFEVL